MKDKEIQKTVTRLKAYAECFRKKTGCTPIEECNKDLCDGCTLLYAQGTTGQHLKDIETAIRVLEKEPCEDTISRSNLLSKLDICYKEKIRVAPDNMAEGFMQVDKLIKQEPPVIPTQKWIPVSDRLPEDNTLVLVTVKVGNREPKVRSGSYYMDGYFHIDNGDCWNSRDKELLAWLPLPESYKGDEDD